MALPSAYQEVEYIQSTGNQYIDTWYNYNWTYFRIDFELMFNSYSYWGTWANVPFICWVIWRSYWNMFMSVWANDRVFWIATWTEIATSIPVQLLTKYNTMLEYKSWTMTFKANDSTVTTSSTGTFYTWKSIPIFCRWDYNGSLYSYFCTDMRMYWCKIYSAENTLARDFIPCYRKSDGKPWLYDLVNDVFYTNAWTGEFEYPAQSGKIKKILLATDLIRPTWQYNWNLYAETNFKNSSYWWFRSMWWYTSSTPSNTAFNTSEWYIYTTWSHAQCKISPQTWDLTRFENANAIKIVFDWIYLTTNSNSYWSNSRVAWFWLDSNSSIFKLADAWVMTWASCVANTWYSWYSIIEKNWSYDNWITYLSNWSVFKCENDWWKWSNIITSNNWFRSDASDSRWRCGRIYADQASNYSWIRLKDIHLYLAE